MTEILFTSLKEFLAELQRELNVIVELGTPWVYLSVRYVQSTMPAPVATLRVACLLDGLVMVYQEGMGMQLGPDSAANLGKRVEETTAELERIGFTVRAGFYLMKSTEMGPVR